MPTEPFHIECTVGFGSMTLDVDARDKRGHDGAEMILFHRELLLL